MVNWNVFFRNAGGESNALWEMQCTEPSPSQVADG